MNDKLIIFVILWLLIFKLKKVGYVKNPLANIREHKKQSFPSTLDAGFFRACIVVFICDPCVYHEFDGIPTNQ